MPQGTFETTLKLTFRGDSDMMDGATEAANVAALITTVMTNKTRETAAIAVEYDEGTHGTPSFTPD